MAAITKDKEFSVYAHLTEWTLTTADFTGDPISYPNAGDKCIQFGGTGEAWGGATAILQGSNVEQPVLGTDADWFPLTDPQGNAISKTALGAEQVMETPLWIRPKLTGVGVGAVVPVRLLSRRNP